MTPAELDTYLMSLLLGELADAKYLLVERREKMLRLEKELDAAELSVIGVQGVKRIRRDLVNATNAAEATQRRVRKAEAALEEMRKR